MQFKNIHIAVVVLICAFISATAQKECRDNTESFKLKGETKTCAQVPTQCGKNRVRNNCPVMCCQCDRTGKFKIAELNARKNCGWVTKNKSKRCSDFSSAKRNCPITCNKPGECPSRDVTGTGDCSDVNGKFVLPNGNKKSCWNAGNKPSLCEQHAIMRFNCPKTCNVCGSNGGSDTGSDTVKPTKTTPTQCDLTIELAFSDQVAEKIPGYHAGQMEIYSSLGEGDNQVCTYNQSTSWCQFHSSEWKANIEIDNDLNVIWSEYQHSTIPRAAGSTARVNVHTAYDTGDTDPHQSSKLFLLVNRGDGNERIGLEQLNPNDRSTHQSYGVDITCTDACECSYRRINPTCEVRAELRYDDALIAKRTKKNIGGYHACYLRAIKENSNEWCSPQNIATTWNCHQDGDAWFNTLNSNSINQRSYTFMTDMADSSVKLYHNHWYTEKEGQQKKDERVPSMLDIYVNDVKKFTTVHDVRKSQEDGGGWANTHFQNGEMNPNYPGSYTQTLSCDGNCNCEVTLKENVECRLYAELTYSGNHYGIRQDELSVTKKGNNDQPCRPWWDCYHAGPSSSHSVNWKDDGYVDYDATETIDILNAAGGRFNFQRKHIPKSGTQYYDDDADTNMVGEMRIYANDVEIFPTDGVSDMDWYGQDLVADVTCTDECACSGVVGGEIVEISHPDLDV